MSNYKKLLTERPVLFLMLASVFSLIAGFTLVLQSNRALTYMSSASAPSADPNTPITCTSLESVIPPDSADVYFKVTPDNPDPFYFVSIYKDGTIFMGPQYAGNSASDQLKIGYLSPGTYEAYVSRKPDSGLMTSQNCTLVVSPPSTPTILQ